MTLHAADPQRAEREPVEYVHLICSECGFEYEGEVYEGEPDVCLICNSERVERA